MWYVRKKKFVVIRFAVEVKSTIELSSFLFLLFFFFTIAEWQRGGAPRPASLHAHQAAGPLPAEGGLRPRHSGVHGHLERRRFRLL